MRYKRGEYPEMNGGRYPKTPCIRRGSFTVYSQQSMNEEPSFPDQQWWDVTFDTLWESWLMGLIQYTIIQHDLISLALRC